MNVLRGEISVMTTQKKIKELELKANSIRQNIIKMISAAGSGHPGGSLGLADILTVLYFHKMNINPKKPNSPSRDYLVLSHGHTCPALYATMAERGFFPKKELMKLRKLNSRIQGHPHREILPGLETTSGPLGSGLSQSVGIALGLKADSKKNMVYCLTSDGEHDEGNTWEAIMLANKYKLGNLVNIVDCNKIQLSGDTADIMPLGSLKQKYLAFGWGVLEIDGNEMWEIIHALETKHPNRPLAIIANTTPGKGVFFMENKYEWHGKAPNEEETKRALSELEDVRRLI